MILMLNCIEKNIKTNPLNYMHVKWTSKYPKMEFENRKEEEFNKGIMSGVFGILKQEKVYIKFLENNFIVYDAYDNSIKVSGKFTFDSLNNMILNTLDFMINTLNSFKL